MGRGGLAHDSEKEKQTFSQWIQAYPQDELAYGNLASLETSFGSWDDSIANSLQYIRLGYRAVYSYADLISGYLATDNLQGRRVVV